MKTKPKCNVPDCNATAVTRGLCGKHYWQANNAADPDHREKITSYMDPPKATGVSKKSASAPGKPAPKPAPGKTDTPTMSPEDDGTRGVLRPQDPRATADDLFHTLGAKSVPIPSKGGVLYFMPEVFKVIWVGPCGKIQPASIHVGEQKELII